MKIAGIGFRETAGIDSLRSALISAGGTDGVMALATAAEKAEAAALVALAAVEHDVVLATRDARARNTYEALGARVAVVAS